MSVWGGLRGSGSPGGLSYRPPDPDVLHHDERRWMSVHIKKISFAGQAEPLRPSSLIPRPPPPTGPILARSGFIHSFINLKPDMNMDRMTSGC